MMHDQELTLKNDLLRTFTNTTLTHLHSSQNFVATASKHACHVFSLNTLRWLTIQAKAGNISNVAVHPQDEFVSIADSRGCILTYYCLSDLTLFDEVVEDIIKSPAAVTILPGGATARKQQITAFTHHWHAHAVRALTFNPAGGYQLSGGAEGVLLQRMVSANKQQFLPRLGSPIEHLAVSPCGSTIAVAMSSNQVLLVDAGELRVTGSVASVDCGANFATAAANKARRRDPRMEAIIMMSSGQDDGNLDSVVEKEIDSVALFEYLVDVPPLPESVPYSVAFSSSSSQCGRMVDRGTTIFVQFPTGHLVRSIKEANNKLKHDLASSVSLRPVSTDALSIVNAGGKSVQLWDLQRNSQILRSNVAAGTYVSQTNLKNVQTEWKVECMTYITTCTDGLLLVTAQTRPPLLKNARDESDGSLHSLMVYLMEDSRAKVVEEHVRKPNKRTKVALSRILSNNQGTTTGSGRRTVSLRLLCRVDQAHENSVVSIVPDLCAQDGSFYTASLDGRVKYWRFGKERLEKVLPASASAQQVESASRLENLLSWKLDKVMDSPGFEPVTFLTGSRDSSLLITTTPKRLDLYQPKKNALLASFALPNQLEKNHFFTHSIFVETFSGALVVGLTSKNELYAWDVANGLVAWSEKLKKTNQNSYCQLISVNDNYNAHLDQGDDDDDGRFEFSSSVAFIVAQESTILLYSINPESHIPQSCGVIDGVFDDDKVKINSVTVLPPKASLVIPRVAVLGSDMSIRELELTASLLERRIATNFLETAHSKVKITNETGETEETGETGDMEETGDADVASPVALLPRPEIAQYYVNSARGVQIASHTVRRGDVWRVYPRDGPSHLAPVPSVLCRNLMRAACAVRPTLRVGESVLLGSNKGGSSTGVETEMGWTDMESFDRLLTEVGGFAMKSGGDTGASAEALDRLVKLAVAKA